MLMAPAVGSFLPRITASISRPRTSGGKALATRKASQSATVGATVLVSCWKSATAIRMEFSAIGDKEVTLSATGCTICSRDAPDEPKMKRIMATAILGIATNGQRNPHHMRRS